ncbi:MAG: hypothetical protein J5634_03725 [Bacilli bacterium]|nr:hypothetical protein [Bacilli bacterium]
MSNYKDFIIKPGFPDDEKKKKKEQEKTAVTPKRSSDLDEIIAIINDYLDLLKSDEVIMKRNKDTFDKFDQLNGKYKEDAYKKIYEIYLKYINFDKQKDIMQINILRTINNYYMKQLREEKQNKVPMCLPNNHVMEEKWVNNNGLWSRKCKICGYIEKTYTDPTKEKKGPVRKRKPGNNNNNK